MDKGDTVRITFGFGGCSIEEIFCEEGADAFKGGSNHERKLSEYNNSRIINKVNG